MSVTRSPRLTPPTRKEAPSSTWKPASLDRFRRALREQLDTQRTTLAVIEASAHRSDRLADDDDAVIVARLHATRRLIADSEQALVCIDDGTYGTCQRCLRDIPLARQEIVPHARYCVTCQQHVDSRED
jgi:DnaK suppressor protein